VSEDYLKVRNFTAMSWREQKVTFRWHDDNKCLVPDQYAYLALHSAIEITARHVAPHINPTTSQSIFTNVLLLLDLPDQVSHPRSTKIKASTR